MKTAYSIILISFLLISCDTRQQNRVIILNDVNLIDGTGAPVQKMVDVVLKDSLIIQIAPSVSPYQFSEALIVEGKGKYLIPGLIDMHAHVTVLPRYSNGTFKADYDSAASFFSLQQMLQRGITTVRNPAAPTEAGISLREIANSHPKRFPTVFTSGSALNTTNQPPFRKVSTQKEVEEEVKIQANVGVDFIKLYASLPDSLVGEAIRVANALEIPVISHLQRTDWTTAARMGIDEITHASPWSVEYLPQADREGYRGLIKDRSYWLEKVEIDSESIRELVSQLKANNVSVNPTLVALHTKFWGDDSVYTDSEQNLTVHSMIYDQWKRGTFIDDWSSEDFEKAREQWPKVQAFIKMLYDAGIPITAGSDFPNPWVQAGYGLHAEMELLHDAGIPALEVIKITTYNGAVRLGKENKIGTIEVGKIADLVLLNADPTTDITNVGDIRMVVKYGQIMKRFIKVKDHSND